MATRTSITAVNAAGPGASSIATAGYNQPAGDTITIRLALESDSATAISAVAISDTAGNTYTQRAFATVDGSGLQYVGLFDCINCVGNASNVITVTFTGNTVQKCMLAPTRWTPSVGISFRAVSAIASGNSTTPLTAAINAGDFSVVAQKNWSVGALTPNSGWTNDYGATEVNAFYRLDSPGGTYTAGCSIVGADVWTIVAASYLDAVVPTVTDVDTDEVITSTQTGVVWAGTNFGASQGGSTAQFVQGTTAISQTVTSWASTSITTTTVFDGSSPHLKYGSAIATVTVGGVPGSLAVTINPPDARSWVTLVSVNGTSLYRITTTPDLSVGDQIEVISVVGGALADVTINADATWSAAPQVSAFTVRVWDATNSIWGTSALKT